LNIQIKNCNNINTGTFELEIGKLNIKYAINGTGKSTIADAISSYLSNPIDLEKLQPFKNREKNNSNKGSPSIEGLDNISSVFVFNEDYINQCLFKNKNLIENCFEIFVNNDFYSEKVEEIKNFTDQLNDVFNKNEEINDFLEILKQLNTTFGGKKEGGIHNASPIKKAIGKGNPIIEIPNEIRGFSKFLESQKNFKWFSWLLNGKEFFEISEEDCPFCTSSIKDKKEKIILVSEKYEAIGLKHLSEVLNAFDKLDQYFSEDTKKTLSKIKINSQGLQEDEEKYLLEINNQIESLILKLDNLKELTPYLLSKLEIEEVRNIKENFKNRIIDLDLYPHFQSEKTKYVLEIMNSTLNKVVSLVDALINDLIQYKRNIQNTINENQKQINDFLETAGIPYKVVIKLDENDEKNSQIFLEHEEFESEIDEPKRHLSFGERNAFSLVLFMYEAIKKNPDLIILDDPISSFDNNKKFAIINKLFRKGGTLQDRTVLFLTHDFEPIIDMLYTLSHIFHSPNTMFLENKDGTLIEKIITKDDIKPFLIIFDEIIDQDINIVSKLIFLRRKLEIIDGKLIGYQLLSNIFKKREIPEYHENMIKRDFTQEERECADERIRKFIPSFDYDSMLDIVKDNKQMLEIYDNSKSGYEKVQIYRIIIGEANEDAVVNKFVNETYHFENDNIMQINPYKYEFVPQYIIEICDKNLVEIRNG
jgi:ABC-type uncharacterized transport system ATPase subunit